MDGTQLKVYSKKKSLSYSFASWILPSFVLWDTDNALSQRKENKWKDEPTFPQLPIVNEKLSCKT